MNRTYTIFAALDNLRDPFTGDNDIKDQDENDVIALQRAIIAKITKERNKLRKELLRKTAEEHAGQLLPNTTTAPIPREDIPPGEIPTPSPIYRKRQVETFVMEKLAMEIKDLREKVDSNGKLASRVKRLEQELARNSQRTGLAQQEILKNTESKRTCEETKKEQVDISESEVISMGLDDIISLFSNIKNGMK